MCVYGGSGTVGVCSIEPESGESQWDRLALGWQHRQTNALHYGPIYLINLATLSAIQASAMPNCQQLLSPLKAPPPHPLRHIHTQKQHPHLMSD